MGQNDYFQLLYDGKLQEAEQLRISTIPDKLIKFIWLDENEKDKKKFKSLENNEIWFSNKKILNDPFEFKGINLDCKKLREDGYQQKVIEAFQKLFDCDEYGISCLSNNEIDYLPMWAYYTNNHKGICVEYDVLNKSMIHKVIYENERVPVASVIQKCMAAVGLLKTTGQRSELDRIAQILLQNLFIKSKQWEHEKEYRIVYPIDDDIGKNIDVGVLGIKPSRIVCGINCSTVNIERLNGISNDLGLGDCYKSHIHDEKYTLEIYR